jgi:formate hydrogenlyase transcriptional activator
MVQNTSRMGENGYEREAHYGRQPDPHGRDFLNDQWLLEITGAVVRTRSVPELLQELGPRVLSLTGCDFLKLALHDPQQDCMITRYCKKNADAGGVDAFPVADCLTGWAWTHQQMAMVTDVDTEQRFPHCIQELRKHGIRSYCVLPLTIEERRYGALGLGKNLPEALESGCVDFLQRLAVLVTIALENQEKNRARDEHRERLQRLVGFAHELNSTLEIERLLPVVFSTVKEMTQCEYVGVVLLEEDKKFLRARVECSISGLAAESHEEGRREAVADVIGGTLMTMREIAIWNPDDMEKPYSPQTKTMKALGLQSVCNVPLLSGDEILGALDLGCVRKQGFRFEDLTYLREMGALIATAFRNASAYREIARLKDRLAKEKRYLEGELHKEQEWDAIVGRSAALRRVLDSASIVATTDSTVIITGETGTGKERVARAIHGMSRRKERSFIKLNCAAIPTGLLESELFGHERGAFTGAVSQKIGRLELADKGTLFLDEIGEIPLELQPKLLRVLQDQEFERLGGTRTIRVDARLISATNRDLVKAVEDKEFRSDLFYRLHVFPLHLPALRDRAEDIPALVHHFVRKCSMRLGRKIETIPLEAMEAMQRWNWPGNIRELENFIERSVILSDAGALRAPLAELRQEIARHPTGSEGTLQDRERDQIIGVLRQTRGLLSGPRGAAARLGVKRTTLQYKLQKLGISRTEYLD